MVCNWDSIYYTSVQVQHMVLTHLNWPVLHRPVPLSQCTWKVSATVMPPEDAMSVAQSTMMHVAEFQLT